MIKLIIGVTLLILILLTSYYILVEKESFQNSYNDYNYNDYNYNDNQNQKCGEGNEYEFSDIHFNLKYSDEYYGNFSDYINKSCYDEFLKDSTKFYENYKKNLDSYLKPLNYKEFHEKMLKRSLENKNDSKKHDTGDLIPRTQDKSHCALYTNDCNLSWKPSEYFNRTDYIDSNLQPLGKCHADSDCKLEDTMLQICHHKCNREVGLNESCANDICSELPNDETETGKKTVYSNFKLKNEFNCWGKNEEKCKKMDNCIYNDEWGYCYSSCYDLNSEQCKKNDTCYYDEESNYCGDKRCYENLYDEKSNMFFPTDITNPVSKKDLRSHYCTKKCEVYENDNDMNSCKNISLNKCSSQQKCNVKDRFEVPKCVPDNN